MVTSIARRAVSGRDEAAPRSERKGLTEPLVIRGEKPVPALVVTFLRHRKVREATSIAVLLDVNTVSGIVASDFFQELGRDEKIEFLAYYVGYRSNSRVSILWNEDGEPKGVICNQEKEGRNRMVIEIAIDNEYQGEVIITSDEKLETEVELLVGQILDSSNIKMHRIRTEYKLSEQDERNGIFTTSVFGQIVNAQLKERQKVCIIKLEYNPKEDADYDRKLVLNNIKSLIAEKTEFLSFASIDDNVLWFCVVEGSTEEIRVIGNDILRVIQEMRSGEQIPAGSLLITYFDSSNLQTQEFSPKGFEGTAEKRPTFIPIS